MEKYIIDDIKNILENGFTISFPGFNINIEKLEDIDINIEKLELKTEYIKNYINFIKKIEKSKKDTKILESNIKLLYNNFNISLDKYYNIYISDYILNNNNVIIYRFKYDTWNYIYIWEGINKKYIIRKIDNSILPKKYFEKYFKYNIIFGCKKYFI